MRLENVIIRSSIICTLHEILLRCSNQGGLDGRNCSTHGGNEKFVQRFGLKA
jgi:hypothetical protein